MVPTICRRWTSASCLIAVTWLLATNAVVDCRGQSTGPKPVFGEETVWRYHAVLRRPVVGTARQPAADQTVGENWVLRNEDFSLAPPAGNWRASNFDDSQWLSQKGPIYGGYGSERPVGVALLCVRGRFLVKDPDAVKDLKLSLSYRGGAVVCLNGEEIARGDMPKGRISPNTLANDYPLEAFVTPGGEALLRNYGKAEPPPQLRDRFEFRMRNLKVDIPNKRLHKGPNTLAIELHRTAIPPDLPEEGRGAWDTAGMVALDMTAASRAGFATEAELAGTKVWVVNPLLPVDATTRAPDVLTSTGRIEVAAPPGGFAAGQICVSSLQGVRGLKVIPSDLVASTGKIPASQVRVRYARFSYKLPALVDRPVDGAPLVPVWLTFRRAGGRGRGQLLRQRATGGTGQAGYGSGRTDGLRLARRPSRSVAAGDQLSPVAGECGGPIRRTHVVG